MQSEIAISSLQRSQVTQRVTLVGAFTNFTLSVAQVIIGILGNSQALVADAMHTFSDLMADGLAYWTARHSYIAPDKEHPYGHGRFETAATLGIATLLTLVGIGIAWFAVLRLLDTNTQIAPNPLALYTAAITVFAKEWLYHYTVKKAQQIKSDMLRASAWHHRSDALSSVLVFVGIGGTLLGLRSLDAVAAAVVGLMIIKIGTDLARNAIRELVDTGLEAKLVQIIRDTILSIKEVRNLHMLRTRKLGAIAMADVHVLVEPRISVSEAHMISVIVEQRLKQAIDGLQDVTVHIDPEDDDVIANSTELPMRTEALRRIDEAWQSIPQVQNRSRILLHYLAGRIEVEVYLPLNTIVDVNQNAVLAAMLQQALQPYPEFCAVRVYCG